jgi:hypothetical protein
VPPAATRRTVYERVEVEDAVFEEVADAADGGGRRAGPTDSESTFSAYGASRGRFRRQGHRASRSP